VNAGIIRALVTGSTETETGSDLNVDTADIFLSLDLSGAISKMKAALPATSESGSLTNSTQSLCQDLYDLFVDENCKLLPVMSKEDFIGLLSRKFTVLTKKDMEALSFRFSDGRNVSVVEFLEFFGSSHTMRRNKAANTAVRMNFGTLSLDYSPDDLDALSPLQIAGSKFLILFPFVNDMLFDECEGAATSEASILSVEKFCEIMYSVCGPISMSLKSSSSELARRNISLKDCVLSKDNVSLLAERFECGGKIDYSVFIDHFRSAQSSPLGINE
jgi:hypothetical protein